LTIPYVAYAATAGQRDFDVPFPYVNTAHVKVRVNGNPTVPFSWPSETRLRLLSGVPSGATVEIERDTPIGEQLVKFQDGNILTAEDLNLAVKQLLFKQQEVEGLYDRSLRAAQVRLGANLGIVTDPESVAQELAELVLEDEVLANFQQRIADIDLNANSIIRQTLEIERVDAAVVSEITARADADSALASSLTAVIARVGDNEAAVLAEISARTTADEALATSVSGLSTRVGSTEAAIVTEQTARATAVSALAQTVTVLSTTIGENTASVSTLQSSVNGLSARYGVSLDVNGYVTGFIQNNDGESGSFVIVADRFAIVTPGAAPTVPFEVSEGVVRIKEAAIGSLNVGKLTDGTLGATINVGSGRIIWDNGVFMKVAGVGFGTTGQFLEWFGPRGDPALCSEVNAITYLKLNGDAYFGGTLSAGILRNAARGTALASNAEVVLGPFGSNGDTRTVVASYEYRDSGQHYEPSAGSGSTTVVVALERSLGGGPWTALTSFNATVSGSWSASFGPTEPGNVNVTGGGSITFTDTTATTGDS
jgi:hypothetical protein